MLGLAGMALYGVDTVAASNLPYLPFDVTVERFIQSVSWGPLIHVFTVIDRVDGVRQQAVGIAAIAVVAAVNWRAAPLVAVGALSGAIYSITAFVIKRPRPSGNLVNVIHHAGSTGYPSGHVAFFSWVLILLIVCLAIGRVPKRSSPQPGSLPALFSWSWASAAFTSASTGPATSSAGWPWVGLDLARAVRTADL